MTRNSTIAFTEFRRILTRLGYVEKRSEVAQVFEHPMEGPLVFRRYRESEPVDERDLRTTRTFLDLRGLLAPSDFDAFVREATTPA